MNHVLLAILTNCQSTRNEPFATYIRQQNNRHSKKLTFANWKDKKKLLEITLNSNNLTYLNLNSQQVLCFVQHPLL